MFLILFLISPCHSQKPHSIKPRAQEMFPGFRHWQHSPPSCAPAADRINLNNQTLLKGRFWPRSYGKGGGSGVHPRLLLLSLCVHEYEWLWDRCQRFLGCFSTTRKSARTLQIYYVKKANDECFLR